MAALVLLAWLGVSALALTKMPRGFAVDSLRFVLHQGLPWSLVLACVASLATLRRPALARAVLECLGALSLIAAAGCAVRFPDSRPLLQGALALVGAVTTLASLALRRTPLPQTVHLASLAVGALLGLAIPEGLRAPDPSTRPSGASVTLPDRSTLEPADQAAQGRLAVEGPGWSLEVDPFFTVESRSPDRSWTVLAPRSQRHSTVWQLHARTSDADAVRTWWRSEDGVGIVAWTPGDPATLEASFTLAAPVYTHLATWALVQLDAPRARVRFSPCGETEIEVRPSDYPEGRPARFAYLAPDDRFVVAEATSGEKGPFHTLCEGRLRREEGLVITLPHEHGRVEITLRDFASQASTEPSPTAGWGVPQNAIQLMRAGNDPSGAVLVHVALAATGIGRGWDTVGLAAGTYHNRIRVRIE